MFTSSRQTRMFRTERTAERRGITLLFVVSIIVLFLLMGTTFVVVSNDYLRGAIKRSRTSVDQSAAVSREAGSALVERAFYEIARGPSLDATSSPLRGHDLLGDQYGYGHRARVAAYTPQPMNAGDPVEAPKLHASQQFITIRVVTAAAPSPLAPISTLTNAAVPGLMTHDATITTAPQIPPGHFNGRLVSVLSGSYRGLTMRVIQSFGNSTSLGVEQHRFFAQPLSSGFVFSDSTELVSGLVGAEILINGRPFSGTGSGRFRYQQEIDEPALNNLATRPNRIGESRALMLGQRTDNTGMRIPLQGTDGYLARNEIDPTTNALRMDPETSDTRWFPNAGGTNEPWDAPDEQNLFLAKLMDANGDDDVGDPDEFEPSFFRESLTTDWETRRSAIESDNATYPTAADKWDAFTQYLRNQRQDFRAFYHMPGDPTVTFPTAANLTTSLTQSVAVDNDNDGTPDGIWIDAGYPVQSTPDGGFVKPLVSYLVLDLDGRINLNTHGNLNEYSTSIDPSDKSLMFGGTATAVGPEGLGFGPAEVSLGTVLTSSYPTGHPLAGQSVAQTTVSRRYGSDGLPGRYDDTRDGKSQRHLAGYPDFDPIGGLFNSELDIYGRYTQGFLKPSVNTGNNALDNNPLFALMPTLVPDSGNAIQQDMRDSPYEFDPSAAAVNGDTPYLPSDLEHVLRSNDRDSFLLDSRLEELLEPDLNANPFLRKLLTTTSFEVPAIPADINKRLYEALPTTGLTDDQREIIMNGLLPREIRRGQPMDLNRIFGNGIDDSNPANGVIDDTDEQETTIGGLTADDPATIGTNERTTIALDTDSDGTLDSGQNNAGVRARINFARRLYILMILLTEREDRDRDGRLLDTGDFFDYDGDGSVNPDDIDAHRKMLAQWCVNVVDFRDPDSIMTPFEFDLEPFTDAGGDFNTWDVDGEPGTDAAGTDPAVSTMERFVVWGAERPELLITETMAMHDVRTEDRADDNGVAEVYDPSDPMSTEVDFDSALVPIASAFIELYNPWVQRTAIQQATAPRELYNTAGNGVDLFALDGNGTPNDRAPVWRMIVVNTQQDPNDATTDVRDELDVEDQLGTAAAEIVRYVYFTEPGSDLTADEFDGDQVYHPPSGAGGNGILQPGNYAVAGSANNESGTNYTTWLGRRTGDTSDMPSELAQTQRIELRSADDEVAIYSDGVAETVRNALAIPLGRTSTTGLLRPLGISDPDDWYDNGIPGTQPEAIDDGFKFVEDMAPNNDVVLDTPADKRLAVAAGGTAWEDSPVRGEGLLPDFRVVYLQRLANPLRPFNALTNPYRVVDSHSVDLYVFNGLEPKTDPDHTSPSSNLANYMDKEILDTFERAEVPGTLAATDPARSIWRTSVTRDANRNDDPTDDQPVASTALSSHILPYSLTNSLGQVNAFYVSNGATFPFPWLTWNNRPYVSQYEITNVPYTSSHWLTRTFGIIAGTGSGASNVYQPPADTASATSATPPQPPGSVLQSVNFSHLLNFYADRSDTASNAQSSDVLHFAFDYLEVPSRFAGTNQYVNTGLFTSSHIYGPPGPGLPPEQQAEYEHLGRFFTAPFDDLPTFRYPGKVNVNTVASARVWNALLGDAGTTAGAYTTAATGVTLDEWNTYLDENPVRHASAANLTSTTPLPVAGSADAGLFRRTTKSNNTPMMDFVSTNAYNDTNRNPYFRNGIRTRLGNLATNRSSVFAVWVTIGYFEFDPETNDLVDVNLSGREYGFDEGTVKRNRGFFIFDRSIPMAYEPGENHNVDDGVLLKSIIE